MKVVKFAISKNVLNVKETKLLISKIVKFVHVLKNNMNKMEFAVVIKIIIIY